jgi:hypothetical protein
MDWDALIESAGDGAAEFTPLPVSEYDVKVIKSEAALASTGTYCGVDRSLLNVLAVLKLVNVLPVFPDLAHALAGMSAPRRVTPAVAPPPAA